MMCRTHPERTATHTRRVVDKENSGQHVNQIVYTRIGMCDECTADAREYIGNTAAIQPLFDIREAGQEETETVQ